ncbi:MAG: HAMP domain-containing histidine kinase [Sphingobacteriia bacterium]|nr:HAMP domain-containing histidine kinase [Sphingobacteriia bacterium]
MRNSASSLYRLLENLLEWSRFQRGTIEFNPQFLSLTRIVNDSFELIQNAAIKKDIEINHQIPEDFEIYGDLHMLDTILRNLTSNAVKFTPKGGTITISAHKDENDNTIITVSDTGIGMSEETIGNLFKVDVNISRTGTEGEPSTGLGLILCKEFTEKHGGKIWVESELGIGSSFNLYLPSKPRTIEPNTNLS